MHASNYEQEHYKGFLPSCSVGSKGLTQMGLCYEGRCTLSSHVYNLIVSSWIHITSNSNAMIMLRVGYL